MSFISVEYPGFEIMKSELDNYETKLVIEKIIRTCYRSEPKITELSHRDMINKILNNDHTAMLEHASITVKLFVDRGCYSDDTEVLTNKGWKLFKDVESEDLLFCLSDKGEASFEKQTEKKVEKKFKGDLLRFETTNIDLLVTPDHMMWVYDYDKRSAESRDWKFLRADELKNSRYVFNKSSDSWNGEIGEVSLNEHPTKKYAFPERVFKKEELGFLWELLGLWVTDGSYNRGNGSGSNITISQIKEKGISRIKYLCEHLGFSYNIQKANIRIGNLQLFNFVESLFGKGPKSTTCFVPEVIKKSAPFLIKHFLDGVILGNGSTKPDGYSCIYTASKKFADDLQELFVKIGVSANIRECEPRNRVFPGNTEETICTKKMYIVSVCREKKSKPMLNRKCAKNFGTKTKYNGFVYCLTVPGHRLYVRRNGKAVWCGNCTHEAVRHRICSFCLSGDTKILRFNQNKNHLTIKEMFERQKDKGLKSRNDMMLLRSMNEDGIIVPNPFKEVIYSGKKKVYRVKTEIGYVIKATKKHIFFTPDGEKKLGDLGVGDKVYVNGSSLFKNKDWLKKNIDSGISVKKIAEKAGCSYHTIRKYTRLFGLTRIIGYKPKDFKPWNAGLTVNDDLRVKNSVDALKRNQFRNGYGEENTRWKKDGLKISGLRNRFSKYSKDVCSCCGSVENLENHHRDKNVENWEKDNLLVLCTKCHKNHHYGYNVKHVLADKILSIEYVGVEDCYDIEMHPPYHNFVAEGFVVHNSQSSTRYIDYTSGLKVVKPYHITMDQINEAINSDSIEKNEAWLFLQSCKSSFNLYCDRIANGASKQQARGSLNHHTQAELVITTNIREWLHIFKLRSDKAAHPDFRIVSRGIQSVFHKKWPLFFRDPGFDEKEMPYVETNGFNSYIVKTPEDYNCHYSGNSYLVKM